MVAARLAFVKLISRQFPSKPRDMTETGSFFIFLFTASAGTLRYDERSPSRLDMSYFLSFLVVDLSSPPFKLRILHSYECTIPRPWIDGTYSAIDNQILTIPLE